MLVEYSEVANAGASKTHLPKHKSRDGKISELEGNRLIGLSNLLSEKVQTLLFHLLKCERFGLCYSSVTMN